MVTVTFRIINIFLDFPLIQTVKNLPVTQGDLGSIPVSGLSSGERNGNPLQYSCPENPMDRGAWWTNFMTQELNQGLLHCRWILYQLSYQGSSQLANTQ